LKECDASGELLVQKQRWVRNAGMEPGLGDCFGRAGPGGGNPSLGARPPADQAMGSGKGCQDAKQTATVFA